MESVGQGDKVEMVNSEPNVQECSEGVPLERRKGHKIELLLFGT